MMMKRLLISIFVISILVGGLFIYKKVTTPDVPRVFKSMEEAEKQIMTEAEEASKLTNSNDQEAYEKLEKELQERYSRPESAVEYLFAIATLGEENYYPDAFTIDQYSSDIFDHEEPDKVKLVKDILNRLTRNQHLESVEMIRSMLVFEKDALRVVADLHYSDLPEPIRVNIKLKQIKMESSHGEEHEQNYYYISSSVWDILKRIEGGEEQ
jgi:uncharacterized protein YxeA